MHLGWVGLVSPRPQNNLNLTVKLTGAPRKPGGPGGPRSPGLPCWITGRLRPCLVSIYMYYCDNTLVEFHSLARLNSITSFLLCVCASDSDNNSTIFALPTAVNKSYMKNNSIVLCVVRVQYANANANDSDSDYVDWLTHSSTSRTLVSCWATRTIITL